ncbi:uncharacterized protein [Apostichopus japonicus]|uniref:uncharacterized protein isoform X2 n=1 Tax=Stichopus japonicus TaxID=307972 RepID=UPI003AB14DC4
MAMYKVWNGQRTIKKVVGAQNREDLICKGKVKLGIPASSSTKLVLGEDGTDVDDDDVLEFFRDKILLLLTTDENWIEPSLAATPTPSTPTRDVEDHLSKSAVTPVSVQHVSQTQETPTLSIRKDMTSASVKMPIPERIDLPEFSPNVVMMLQNNQGGEIFNAVLKEAAVYYQFKYPGMKDSTYYQAIGKKLVTKYPCLEHDGMRKWSYFSSKLSSRIRQLRLKENRKTSLTTCDSAESPDMPVAKRFHLGRPTTGKVLSEDDFLERCNELVDEWNGQRREATIKMLMADVRPNLSSWRLGKTVKEVVAMIPCLQDGGYTMDSSLNLLQSLEKKVAVVKGKGTKSKSVFTILEVDNIDMQEDVLRRKLGVKDKAPLELRILTIDNDIKMIYAVGEGVTIDCRTTNSLEAIVALLGGYYIFDLNYPAIYGQLLGFLQQHILEEPYTYFKGSNYQQFSNKLKFSITEL